MTAPAPNACPRCGATAPPDAVRCPECGQRFPGRDPFQAPRSWVWRVLGFFVLAALGALVAIVASHGANSTPDLIGTEKPTGPTVSLTTPTTTPVTVQQPVTEPTVTTKPPKKKPPRAQGGLVPWPNRDGYTVVLQSLPTTSGRDNAVRTARQAIAAGLQDVGVLDSAAYSSLHPGYYVVFSGIYSSAADAASGVSAAHAAGFSAAYERPVTH
jgi:hypothetical protein